MRDCARAVLDGLPPVMWFIRQHMRRHRAAGLSVPQFRMLVLLDRYPAACLSAAADHLGCSLPAASRMISGLVDKRLVTRRECPGDRRQISLALTPRGRDALQSSRQATHDLLARELSRLSETERAGIAAAMRLLRSIFSKDSDGLCKRGN